MAYNGTTALSSVANPPIEIARSVGGNANSLSTGGTGLGLWLYNSSAGSTDATVANYFTDAFYLGMKQGDVIICVGCSGSSAYVQVNVIGAVTTAGACVASTGGSLSSTR